MQGMKGIVAVMSALIVIGLCLLVYGIVRKAPRDDAPPAAAETASLQIDGSAAAGAPPPNGTRTITLPARSRIRQLVPYSQGVAFHVATPQGDFVYFVNTAKGSVDGALKLEEAPYRPRARQAPSRQQQPQQQR